MDEQPGDSDKAHQNDELEQALLRELATREILELIGQSRQDEKPVFDAILKNASHLCHAPLAALFLISKDGRHYEIAAQRGARPEFLKFIRKNPPELDPARYVAARAMIEMQTAFVEDLADPGLYGAQDNARTQSVALEGVRSAVYVPLIAGGRSIGGIALYRRVVQSFSTQDVALVEAFAAQATIAIENARQFKAMEALNAELEDRVQEQVDEIERMSRLKRFLPPAVADTVISRGAEDLLRSHRAFLGVLFCDIRGFTAFCETAEPEETIEVLQSYHEEMGVLIASHHAGVDARAGDGIMVLFNDPLPCEDPAGDALRLALDMQERMRDLCKNWRRHGYKLGFGVGISLGFATVGMVGSGGRYDYTASGTAVNLAARLCDKAADGEILLSPRACAAVEDQFTADAIGEMILKGIHAPVEVFRVSGAT